MLFGEGRMNLMEETRTTAKSGCKGYIKHGYSSFFNFKEDTVYSLFAPLSIILERNKKLASWIKSK